MAERYLVTGVQLGMIKALSSKDPDSVTKLVDEIVKSQFLGSSNNSIQEDCHQLFYDRRLPIWITNR